MKKIKLFGVLIIALVFSVAGVRAEEEKSLQDLIDEASNGTVITLRKDYTESIEIDNKNITLNLNGHKITSAEDVVVAKNSAVVVVTGNGTIQSTGDSGISIYSGSTVTFENGTIKAQEFGVYTSGNATFTMNGGLIETVDNCGIGGNGSNKDSVKNYTININGGTINANIKTSGYISCGVYHPNKGTVNIAGGVINSSNGAGVVQRAGTLNITGGTINAIGTMAGKVGDASTPVHASAVVIDKETAYSEVATLATKISKVAVLNGEYKDIEKIGNDIVVELTGGIYNEEPQPDEIPEGYEVYEILYGENEGKIIVAKEEDLVVGPASEEMNKEEIETMIEELLELYEKAKNGEIEYTEEDMEEFKMVKEFKETVEKYTVVGYYDIILATKTPEGYIVDDSVEPEGAVEVTLEIPENLPEVKEGYTRKYYVVRIHDNEITVIDNVKVNDDGTITFKSDKFSVYALAYDDAEEVKNVETYDGLLNYIIISAISSILLLGGVVYFKKRFN